jgi:hypothetical protein
LKLARVDIRIQLAAILKVSCLTESAVGPTKNPHVVALGRLGGLTGGVAKAAALGPRKPSQIAAKAAMA